MKDEAQSLQDGQEPLLSLYKEPITFKVLQQAITARSK
jgi:hypothetical protein